MYLNSHHVYTVEYLRIALSEHFIFLLSAAFKFFLLENFERNIS